MNPWIQIAEEKIQESLQNGEDRELEGKGAPIDLDAYFSLPASVRAGYGLLKSAGVSPPEVESMKQLKSLKDQFQVADEETRKRLRREWIETETMIQMAIERLRIQRQSDL